MKKFLILAAAFALSMSAAFSTEVELDLSYVCQPVRSYTFKDAGKTKLNAESPFGLTVNTAIYFGHQNEKLFAFGLDLFAGMDFSLKTEATSHGIKTTNSDDVFIGGVFGGGPAIRIKPMERFSFVLIPALTFNFITSHREHTTYNYYSGKAITTETDSTICTAAFDINLGARLWITKRFGFNAGMNFNLPFTGLYINKVNKDTDVDVMKEGFAYKLYLGLSWGFGR